MSEIAVETWSWGEMFELDVPVGWLVTFLEGAVELRPGAGGMVAFVAPFDHEGGPAGEGIVHLLEQFAQERGVTGLPTPRLRTARGVTHAAVAFSGEGGHWRAHVMAWPQPDRTRGDNPVVLCTACDADPGSADLALAEAVFETLRPGVVTADAADELAPDAPGDF